MLSKLLLATLLASTPFLLTGCDDNDLAVGLGGAALGAGAVLIYDQWGHNDHHNHNHHHNNHHWGHGGGSHWHNEHNHWHGGGWGHRPRELRSVDETSLGFTNTEWAATYNMPPDRAEVFLQALETSRAGDLKDLYALGLSRTDLQTLATLQLPEKNNLEIMASRLQQAPQDTERMLQDLIRVISKDAQNENGMMWTQCKSAGEWKTPKNSMCRETWWNGCGPTTGAQFCSPVLSF